MGAVDGVGGDTQVSPLISGCRLIGRSGPLQSTRTAPRCAQADSERRQTMRTESCLDTMKPPFSGQPDRSWPNRVVGAKEIFDLADA